jgi:hypothetical protein
MGYFTYIRYEPAERFTKMGFFKSELRFEKLVSLLTNYVHRVHPINLLVLKGMLILYPRMSALWKIESYLHGLHRVEIYTSTSN